MKTTLRIAALVAVLFSAACNTTVVETYDPVTGKLTGRSTVKNLDAEAFTAGATAVTTIAGGKYEPKGRVRHEK